MNVTHQAGRRTTLQFQEGFMVTIITWLQPYNQSYLPNTIRNIVTQAEAGDASAVVEYHSLCSNNKLVVQVMLYSPARGIDIIEPINDEQSMSH